MTTGDPREELLRVAALCLRDQTGPVIRALPLVAGLPGVDPELLHRASVAFEELDAIVGTAWSARQRRAPGVP